MFLLHSAIQNSNIESTFPSIKYADSNEFVHACTLNTSTISDLLSTKPCWVRTTIVTESNPESKRYFSSTYMFEEEIKNHLIGPYWYIIHPCSKFAMIWEQVMLVAHLLNWYIVLFQIANHNDLTSVSEHINFIIQIPCYINIVLQFFIGHFNHYESVLDQRDISRHYLKTWFISDVITSIPFQVVKRLVATRVSILWLNVVILYQGLKILTFSRIKLYFKHLWSILNLNYEMYMLFVLALISLLVFHVMVTFYQFGANIVKLTEMKNTHPLNFVNRIDVDSRIGVFWFKYLLAHYLTVLKFYCFTFEFSKFSEDLNITELLISSTIIFVAFFYHLFAIVKLIQYFQFRHSSTIRYQEIMNQLKKYMRTKHLPQSIKKSLIEFYEQRYQYRFYKERSINENLSESLRRELILHCGQLFIRNIEIFKDIPDKILTDIVSCLKPEIFMPNDLIIKAGTIGDCMYFIASGTVSIRTRTGKELLHLEDGDHFGEISLFSKHGRRVTNIVAIEYCEIYRLDKADYEANIAVIPELADKFETLALHRMNETNKIEKKSKSNQNNIHEFDNSDGESDVSDSELLNTTN